MDMDIDMELTVSNVSPSDGLKVEWLRVRIEISGIRKE